MAIKSRDATHHLTTIENDMREIARIAIAHTLTDLETFYDPTTQTTCQWKQNDYINTCLSSLSHLILHQALLAFKNIKP